MLLERIVLIAVFVGAMYVLYKLWNQDVEVNDHDEE